MKRHFHDELEHLKKELYKMSLLVEKAVERSCQALLTRDESLAKEVIEGDKEINQLYQESEKSILLQKKGFVEQNKIKLSTQIENAKNRIAELTDSLEGYREQIYEEKELEESLESELDTVETNLNTLNRACGRQ